MPKLRRLAALCAAAACACTSGPSPSSPPPAVPAAPAAMAPVAPALRAARAEAARQRLEARRSALGLSTEASFSLRAVEVDALGMTHARFRQLHRGVPVLGAEVVTHTGADGREREATLDLVAVRELDTTPAVSAAHAIATAEAGQRRGRLRPSSATLVVAPERVLRRIRPPRPGHLPNAQEHRWEVRSVALAWWVHTEPLDGRGARDDQDYLVDARTGAVLQAWPSLQTAVGHSQYSGDVDLTTVPRDGAHALVDAHGCATFDAAHTDGSWGTQVTTTLYVDADDAWGDGLQYAGGETFGANGQTAAVDAAFGVERTWDYFLRVHGRDGIDGLGTPTSSRVHFSTAFENAFWDPSCFCMTFGDGTGRASGGLDTLTALDVVGHELAHGVTEHTANLEYRGESGGLNEATSDIFGTLIEFDVAPGRANWTEGEQLGASPLRYLYRPSLDGVSPDAWTPWLWQYDVHYSSGPMNRAFYFLAEGASADPASDTWSSELPEGMLGVGREVAGRIWYRALAHYLTPTSDYLAARKAALFAAEDLFGHVSREYQAVQDAFAAIAVGDPSATAVDDFLPPTGVTARVEVLDGGFAYGAEATDLFDVQVIEYLVDGHLAAVATARPWRVEDRGRFTPGAHALVARAWDANGNAAESAPVAFTASDPGQVLVNPGFEEGDAGWTATAGAVDPANDGPPLAGVGFARLGGLPYHSWKADDLAQQVTVPAGGATLDVRVHMWTDAPPGATALDELYVAIFIPGYGWSATAANLTLDDAAPGYVQRTYDLALWAGQTITLDLDGIQVGDYATGWLVDELSIRTPDAADVTPPTASCRVDQEKGRIFLAALADDRSGVATADLLVDGIPVVTHTRVFGHRLDPATLTEGDHLFSAVIRDAVGNAGTCQAPFHVVHPPAALRNGDFEDVVEGQRLEGWEVSGNAGAHWAPPVDAYTRPEALSGQYAAELGGAPGEGRVEQLVTLPVAGRLTLSYAVRMLTVYADDADHAKDSITLEVWDAAGTTLIGGGPELSGSWFSWYWPFQQETVGLSALAGQTVRLVFHAKVGSSVALTRFLVDDVRLEAGEADREPPALKLTVTGSQGWIALAADATDPIGVRHAELRVDGALVATAEWTHLEALYDGAANPGSHVAEATAVDAAGNVAVARKTFETVRPPLDTTPPSVTAAASATGTDAALEAQAQDTSGISGVDFLVDGRFVGHARTAPYAAEAHGLAPGSHELQARAFDGAGNAGVARALFVVGQAGHAPPSVDAGEDRSVEEDDPVTLTASATAADGQVVAVRWEQLSGPRVRLVPEGAAASFVAPAVAADAALTFQVTATDDASASATDVVHVVVRDVANQPPTADAGPAQQAHPGDAVVLRGTGTDADGRIVAWQWVQVDGPWVALEGTGAASASFTMPDLADGTVLRFRLTVEDNHHAQAAATTTVTASVPKPAGKGGGCSTAGGGGGLGWLAFALAAALPRRRRR